MISGETENENQTTILDGGFDDFRRLASDPCLSRYEKIGFPNFYREGYEEEIFKDIRSKLGNLDEQGAKVLDIGPGCSDLPNLLIKDCARQKHSLFLIDSAEMLALLPDTEGVVKIAGAFPSLEGFFEDHEQTFDAIICYSVLQYIFVEYPLFRFLDKALSLIAPRGRMLIGDIPNVSKRKRFFASEAGHQFHRKFMNNESAPEVEFNKIEHNKIDDSVVFSLMQRARTQGFDAYLLPQGSRLPMANRREDILIVRP